MVTAQDTPGSDNAQKPIEVSVQFVLFFSEISLYAQIED